MRCRPLYLLVLLCPLFAPLAACTTATAEDERSLTVFAAASLSEAFTALGEAFEEAYPGTEVILNFAGSQQLAQQLAQGAPGDVFASADERQMAAAVASGRVGEDAPRPFAHNRLVVAIPAGNPAAIEEPVDLANPGVSLVLAAADVPAGQYTLAFLDRASTEPAFGAGFRADVLDNVVSYEQNVRAVLTKVALGEADAGIVYQTDLLTADEVTTLEIPEALNPPVTYPIAVLDDAVEPELAEAFVRFVLSPRGQQILADYGFTPAGPPE